MQLDLMTLIPAPTLSSGRMSTASCPTTQTPSDVSLRPWWERTPPSLRHGTGGQTRVWLLDPPEKSVGVSLMLKGLSRSVDSAFLWSRHGMVAGSIPAVCFSKPKPKLSSILETGPVPARYSLSPKARAGILRRAEARGRELPAMLKAALMSVARLEGQAQEADGGSAPMKPLLGSSSQPSAATIRGGAIDTATALNAHGGPAGRMDFESETFVATVAPDIAQALRARDGAKGVDSDCTDTLVPMCITGDITHALNTANNGKGSNEDGTGRGVPTIAFRTSGNCGAWETGERVDALTTGTDQSSHLLAYTTKLHNTTNNNAGKIYEERTTCLDANSPSPALIHGMSVRHLTPLECSRLQGFPDGYTLIPTVTRQGNAKWRRIDADEAAYLAAQGADVTQGDDGRWLTNAMADGPRYKGFGNSWNVDAVRWVFQRLDTEWRRASAGMEVSA